MSSPRVLLVDPSLFTAPYDAALTRGLVKAGLEPRWAVRPLRPGDRTEIDPELAAPFFYRDTDKKEGNDALRKIKKGFDHARGLFELADYARRVRSSLIHFQWTVVPSFDAASILALRRRYPIVVTVHDAVPYNGEKMPLLQRLGVNWPLHLADRVIVHTLSAKETVKRRGVPASKVAIVAHGPLSVPREPDYEPPPRHDSRYTFVTFGEMKPYKGIDVLIEAIARLPESQRSKARFIVAGRPRLDLEALEARASELGLGECLEFIPRRLSDREVADLISGADCFVFPYRQIDASGVYFLSKSEAKWMIASEVGIFAEDLRNGETGRLVPPGDAEALSVALGEALESRPSVRGNSADPDWTAIGEETLSVYRGAYESWSERRQSEPGPIDAAWDEIAQRRAGELRPHASLQYKTSGGPNPRSVRGTTAPHREPASTESL